MIWAVAVSGAVLTMLHHLTWWVLAAAVVTHLCVRYSSPPPTWAPLAVALIIGIAVGETLRRYRTGPLPSTAALASMGIAIAFGVLWRLADDGSGRRPTGRAHIVSPGH